MFRSGLVLSPLIASHVSNCMACISLTVGGFLVSGWSQHDKNSCVFTSPHLRGDILNLPLGSKLERSLQIRLNGITRAREKDETDGEERG